MSPGARRFSLRCVSAERAAASLVRETFDGASIDRAQPTCFRTMAGKGWASGRRARNCLSTIVSIHSFRGGTGKSNTTANVAALLAQSGKRVGVIDAEALVTGEPDCELRSRGVR
jgi:Mrp family chromosome partitioning ATPase